MVGEALLRLFAAWSRFGLTANDSTLYTFRFLSMLNLAVFPIMSARERRSFWVTMPGFYAMESTAITAFGPANDLAFESAEAAPDSLGEALRWDDGGPECLIRRIPSE